MRAEPVMPSSDILILYQSIWTKTKQKPTRDTILIQTQPKVTSCHRREKPNQNTEPNIRDRYYGNFGRSKKSTSLIYKLCCRILHRNRVLSGYVAPRLTYPLRTLLSPAIMYALRALFRPSHKTQISWQVNLTIRAVNSALIPAASCVCEI